MRVDRDGEAVVVVLSRRNVLALLAKLNGRPPFSNRTIQGAGEFRGLFVRIEEDADHYGDREPGAMHPATEREIARLNEVL